MTRFTEDLIAETDAYLKSLEGSELNAVPQNPSAAKNEQGFIGDVARSGARGVLLGLQGIGESMHQFLPGVGSDIGGFVRDAAGHGADNQMEAMSPRMQEAMGKEIFAENEDGDLILGEGATDPYTLAGNLSQTIGQYIDVMAGGAGLAKIGSITTAKILGKATAKKSLMQGATKEAAEQAGKDAAQAIMTGNAQQIARVTAYGGLGAAMAGGMVGVQTKEEILNLTDQVLDQSEEYKRAYWQLADENPGSDVATLRQQAKELIADKAAAEVQRDPLLIASNVAMEAIGGKFLDDLFRGVGTGSRLTNAGKQFGIQGATEAVQGGVEQYASNTAIIDNADPNRDQWQDVKSNAATEALFGGAIGGMGGAVTGGKPQEANEKPQDEQAPEARKPSSQPNQPLGLQHDGVIYGEAPAPTQDQINARQATLDAYEAQHGEAQNVGLDGEYLGQSLPEQNNQRQEEIIEGEIIEEIKQLENRSAPQITDDGTIYAGTDAQPKPEREDGMTAQYTEPKLSRKATQELEQAENKSQPVIAKGEKSTAWTPDNQPVETSYALVDLADLKISHDEAGRANPDYPQELQQRARSNVASRVWIAKTASSLNPERLADSPNVSDGAPIIGSDGVVESGNGRSAAIRLAYKMDTPAGKNYKSFAIKRARELGVSTEQAMRMKQPVLVRVREGNQDRQQFTRNANVQQVATQNRFEQAKTDAEKITSDLMTAWNPSESGNPLAASNQEFVQSFAQTLGQEEAASLMRNDGRANQEMGRRIKAAVFHKAYKNEPLVESLTNEEGHYKNLMNALSKAAPDFALAREINSEIAEPVIKILTDGFSLAEKAREAGQTVNEYITQQDAFAEPATPEAKALANLISINRSKPTKLSEMIAQLAIITKQQAEQSVTESLFGDQPLTPAEIVNEAEKRTANQQGDGANQADIRESAPPSERDRKPRRETDSPTESIATVQEAPVDQPLLESYTQEDLSAKAEEGAKAQEQTTAVAPWGDRSFTLYVDEEYGPPSPHTEAYEAAKSAPKGSVTHGLTVRPSGKQWHNLYLSHGNGDFSSVSVGKDMPSNTAELIEQGFSDYDNKQKKQANALEEKNAISAKEVAIAKENNLVLGRELATIIPNTGKQFKSAKIITDHGDGTFTLRGVQGNKQAELRGLSASSIVRAMDRHNLEEPYTKPKKSRKADQPEAEPDQPLMESYTQQEIEQRAQKQRQQQEDQAKAEREAAQREQAEREVDDFVLTGSNSKIDQAEARGQNNLFDQAAQQVDTQPSEAQKEGSSNKVFTDEMAQKARERLRKKMSQFNSGLDPEMLQDGIVLAGYHIEKGARRFAEFAGEMLSDMGEGIRPYLKQFYLAAKMDPRMPQDVVSDMDKAGIVEDYDTATITPSTSEADTNVPDTTNVTTSATRDGGNNQQQSEGDTQRERPESSSGNDGQASPGSGRREQGSSGRLGDSSTTTKREQSGDTSSGKKPGRSASDTRSSDSGRGHTDSTTRLLSERERVNPVKPDTKSPDTTVTQTKTIKAADLANIKEQMPFLTEGQAKDVAFAEQRFSKDDGFGVLFTNGTGTGKTFTGLGVISRYSKAGKNNILIAAPSQAILDSWVKAAKKFFNLDISLLPDTESAGSGITATTFANLGSNNALATRDWDLIVADEAHYLSSGQQGKSSLAHNKINALGLKDGYEGARATALNPELVKEMKELQAIEDKSAENESRLTELTQKLTEAKNAEKERIKSTPDKNKPRGIFLSATPFAYVPNVAWANGWLFDWGNNQEQGLRYNSGDNRSQFFMQNFGYRMRYNRLTKPEAEVDNGLMERQFNSTLKKQGVLSSRKLDSEFDYDRKFILTETALGHKIDEALTWLRENDAIEGMSDVSEEINKAFDYHTRIYLLESLKAREAIPYIQGNLDMGRKVVVMHDRKKGGIRSPFILNFSAGDPAYRAYNLFKDNFRELIDGFGYLPSVIDTLTDAFPNAMIYNGSVPAKERIAIQDKFNSSDKDANLIIAQGDAMREGVSIHDTTGKHQRVLMNLGLPVKPVSSIQQEGRIYRVGQASDAVFRYFTIGTNWERWAFASTIAERSSTAENLAMGEEARGLKQSFIDAYENADTYQPSKEEGKGGKEIDQTMTEALTPWDSAKAFYFGTKKQGKGRSSAGRENSEYFATPEPVGLKMVELANINPEERVLEPSAGHGAIARWIPDNVTKRAIEMEMELSSKLALRFEGDVVTGKFEDHNIINKYDAIVMNPPFGQGGKMAADHVAKAIKHLKEGGRIVALIPRGPAADKRFDKLLFDNDDTSNIHMAAEILMPSVTFSRAGTAVNTRIIVLEKQSDQAMAEGIQQQNRDYTSAENINELFDRMESLEIRPRQKTEPKTEPTQAQESLSSSNIIEHTTKRGKVLRGIVRRDLTREQAKEIDQYTFKKDGGFFIREQHLTEDQLSKIEDQQVFENEYPEGMTADQVQEIAASLGKIGDYVQVVQSSTDLPLAIQLGNAIKGIASNRQQGVYWQGKTYVIADNLFGTQQATDVIMHEVVGHRGMRGLLGKELTPIMLQIYDSFKDTASMEQLRSIYKHYDPKNKEHRQYLAEELLAHAAEYNEKPGLVKRAIATIRRLLRKAFPNIAWTSNDIYALIDSSRRFVERKNSELSGNTEDGESLSRLFGAKAERADEYFSDLSDDAKAALKKIAPETIKQKAGHWLKAVWDRAGLKLKQGMVDRYASLMELDKKRFGEGALEENIASSSFVLARMASNASGAVSALMQHGRIYYDKKEGVIDVDEKTVGKGGLTGVLYQLGSSVEIERFMGWIAGNRAHKLAQEGRENLFTEAEINALKDVNSGTLEGGRSRAEVYDKVFKEFQEYRDDVLNVAEQAGIITPENRAIWRDEFYVPFYRVADEDLKKNGPINQKGLSRQEAYKRLKGGKQNLNDLLENTIMNFHHLIDASLKNIAATQAIDNAADLGISEVTSEAGRDKDNSTWIMRDGKKEWHNISDPLVYNSLVSLTSPAMQGPAMKLMRAAKRVFTQTVTITPQFQVANLLRDSMQAIATSKMPYNLVTNMTKGMSAYGIWNKDSLTRARMMATGGSMSFGHIYGADPEGVKLAVNSQLKKAQILKASNAGKLLKGALGKWMDINDSFENINRASIFNHNYGEGSKLKAAWEARDLIDFSSHGAWPAVRFLIDTVPFLNARIQGLDKLYRSGVKPTAQVVRQAFGGKSASESDKAAAKRFSIVTGAIALATMSLYMANKDDEEYKKLEEWQKDSYWFVRVGDSGIFIPKPFEVGAIATFAERLLEQIVDDEATGKLFAQRMGHMLSDTFSMNPTPQLFMPALEVFSNKSTFTGRQIESQAQQRLSPGMRSNASTSSIASGIGGALNISPLQIDHLIKGYLGQVGAWGLSVGTFFTDSTQGKESPSKAFTEYQPIRRFYRDLSLPGYTKYQTLFYDRLNEVNTVYADIRKYREMGELEKAVELAEKNKSLLAQRKVMGRISRQLSKLNARTRIIRASNMDGDKKRRELDRLQTMKNRLTEMTIKNLPAA